MSSGTRSGPLRGLSDLSGPRITAAGSLRLYEVLARPWVHSWGLGASNFITFQSLPHCGHSRERDRAVLRTRDAR